MSGVATYNKETNTVELAVSTGMQSGYQGFVKNVNAYGNRAWEIGGQFDGVARKDERISNIAQEALAAISPNAEVTQGIEGINNVAQRTGGKGAHIG